MVFQGRKLCGIRGSVCVQLAVLPTEVDSAGDQRGCQVTIWLLRRSMIHGKRPIFGQLQRIPGSGCVVAEQSRKG